MELDVRIVISEGDAQVVIKVVNNEDENWSCYDQFIDDIRSLLRGRIGGKVAFTHRAGNGVAYQLAKLSFTYEEEHVWIQEGPDIISGNVLKYKFYTD